MSAMATRWYRSRRYQMIVLGLLLLSLIYYTLFTNEVLDVDITRRFSVWPATLPALEQHKTAVDVGTSVTDGRKSMIQDIEKRLQEALKLDKGTGCHIPKMDPFDKEVTQFDVALPKVVCKGMDWVRCHLSECRVKTEVLESHKHVVCVYQDLIYDTDDRSHYGKEVKMYGDAVYSLVESDHAKVTCYGKKLDDVLPSRWSGYVVGYRKSVERKPPLRGRESNVLNVLIFGFDSTSKNGFIRRMPLSYKMLVEEMDAVILNGYNIIGDGTPAALFPILTGKNELELPDVRRVTKKGSMDLMPWIFYKLKDDGYRTAYFEDMPWIGTFQYRFNGWKKQPADHYLRHFFLQESNHGKRWWSKESPYCVGDTPSYGLMMNLTQDFFKLDGKKYCFTFIADITHDDFNMIQTADEDFKEFLRKFKEDGRLEDTLLMVMGDHGPRYAKVRGTFLGKLEERHPLMAIMLPEKLKQARPDALEALKRNVEVLTTPHDIYATVLDVLDMRGFWNLDKVPGADLARGLTLLETIPASRSCSEAGVEPHWCTCMQWRNLSQPDPMYKRAAAHLVYHINTLTEQKRQWCMPRYLTSIDYVMKQQANSRLLKFRKNKDDDGYIGKFDTETKVNREEYTVKISVGPGKGVYEASLSYLKAEKKFILDTRAIQRTNAYGDEPSCISKTDPHLNMFCYCVDYYVKFTRHLVQEYKEQTEHKSV